MKKTVLKKQDFIMKTVSKNNNTFTKMNFYQNIKNFYVFFILFLNVCFFISCSNKSSEDTTENVTEQNPVPEEKKRYAVQNIFNTMPDYNEILNLIDQNKIEYNPDYLHDPTLYKKYNTEEAMAFNLGVYGADLSITRLFNQTQESITFLKSLNFLAQKIGIQNVFSDKLYDRLEQYKDIKDSSVQIIISAFVSADQILNHSHRGKTSSLMITGAWVEAFYISCKIAMEKNNFNLAKALFSQDNSLSEVITMLEIEDLNEQSRFIYNDLKILKNILKDKQPQLNNPNVNLSELLHPLSESITRIREKITNLS